MKPVMPRARVALLAIMLLCVWIGSEAVRAVPDPKTIVAHSGDWDLLQSSIDDAIQVADILAGAEMSATDEAALRNDLIAQFKKDPGKQVEIYKVIVSMINGGVRQEFNAWPQLATLRYNYYHYAFTPHAPFDSAPVFDSIVVKYNPVLTRNRDWLILRTSVESRFHTDELVATVAGVRPPTQVEKDQFMRDLPARFASMPREEQEQLAQAEIRAADFDHIYHTGIKARSDMIADIRRNVHSHADIWREARRVESETRTNGRYWLIWKNETGMPALCSGCIGPLLWLRTSQQIREWRSGEHLEVRRPPWSVLSHCTQRWPGCAQPVASGKQ